MSQPAFIFAANLCTGCAACAIACQIENNRLPVPQKQGPLPWRTIYSHNPSNLPGLAGFHLSLACNHCLEPACLAACPAAAISKDSLTGAVLIDPRRCIGCGYCAWACPFDAPKYNPGLGVMEKCTFCQPRLLSGSQPACVTACPTGALHLGLLSHEIPGTTAVMSGFPKTTMRPAIRFEPARIGNVMLSEAKHLMFSGDSSVASLPQNDGFSAMTNPASQEITLRREWPLWVLTVSFPALFAWFAGYPAARHLGWAWLDGLMFSLGALALLVSMLHLGKPWRAWRAVLNANTSWLSREIIFTSAFLVLAGSIFGLSRINTNDLLHRAGLLAQVSLLIPGFLALLSIDMVYAVLRFHDSPPAELYRPRLQPHSGLALLSGFYLAGIVAFSGGIQGQALQAGLAYTGLVCGALQLGLYANRHAGQEPANPWQAVLRFLRVGVGFALPGILLAANAPGWMPAACAVLGTAIDRAEFYTILKRVRPGW